jgi:hypothetical protein
MFQSVDVKDRPLIMEYHKEFLYNELMLTVTLRSQQNPTESMQVGAALEVIAHSLKGHDPYTHVASYQLCQ